MSMFKEVMGQKGVNVGVNTTLELEKLIAYSLNDELFSNDDNAIERMADSIKRVGGLLQPIVIDSQVAEDGSYTIIGGHTRINALKKLFEEGVTGLTFNNTDIDEKNIPVIYLEVEGKTQEEREIYLKEGVITSNNYRSIPMEQKLELFIQTRDMYRTFIELGIDMEMSEREYIISVVGMSKSNYHYVKNIVDGNADKNKPVAEREPIEEIDRPKAKKITSQEVMKNLNKIIKATNILEVDVQTLSQEDFSYEDMRDFSERLNEVVLVLNNIEIKKS